MNHRDDCPLCVAQREGHKIHDYVISSLHLVMTEEDLTADVKNVSQLTVYRILRAMDAKPTDEVIADLKQMLAPLCVAWHWSDHADALRPFVADKADEWRDSLEVDE